MPVNCVVRWPRLPTIFKSVKNIVLDRHHTADLSLATNAHFLDLIKNLPSLDGMSTWRNWLFCLPIANQLLQILRSSETAFKYCCSFNSHSLSNQNPAFSTYPVKTRPSLATSTAPIESEHGTYAFLLVSTGPNRLNSVVATSCFPFMIATPDEASIRVAPALIKAWASS